MIIKDFYKLEGKQIDQLKSFKFEDGLFFEEFWKNDPSEYPLPLKSPQMMLLARQLAVHVSPYDSFTEILKGKWQRYWLRCCLRDECNYFFAIFKELGIDREEDVEKIIKDNYLWDIINSEEGQKFYKQTIADWFIRRYNKKKAKSVLKTITCIKWLDKIRIWYPRLIVAILIGFLPLITQKDMWLMPLNLSLISIVVISIFLLALSYGYLIYECNKIINNIREAKARALYPCLKGLFISLVFSVVICLSIGPAMLGDRVENITKKNYFLALLELGKFFLKDIILFAFSALFVGIFIQLLWEEKTVTEPL